MSTDFSSSAEIIDINRSRLVNGVVYEGVKPRTLFPIDIRALPDPEWLVKGVFEYNSMAMVFGPYGCGKSFLVADIGVHIALGWDWQGHKVKQGGVLYVCIEGGSKVKHREAAIEDHYGVDLTDVPFGVVKDPTNIFAPHDVEQLIVDAMVVPDLRLIIIDTANRVMPGTKEDTEDMGKLVAVCGRLQAETGATVLVVHHTGKDEGRGSRGGSNAPGAMDTNLSVKKDKRSGVSSVEIEKQRDGPDGPLLSFKLKVIELGFDEDGDAITSCIVEPVDASEIKEANSKLSDKESLSLQHLQNALAKHGESAPDNENYPAGATVVSIDLWKETLFSAGVLVRKDDGHRTKFSRMRDGLAKKGAIGQWNDLVWVVAKESRQ